MVHALLNAVIEAVDYFNPSCKLLPRNSETAEKLKENKDVDWEIWDSNKYNSGLSASADFTESILIFNGHDSKKKTLFAIKLDCTQMLLCANFLSNWAVLELLLHSCNFPNDFGDPLLVLWELKWNGGYTHIPVAKYSFLCENWSVFFLPVWPLIPCERFNAMVARQIAD